MSGSHPHGPGFTGRSEYVLPGHVRRRKGIAIGVSIALILAVGMWVWPSPHIATNRLFGELDRSLGSYSAPDGYALSRQSRSGEDCKWNWWNWRCRPAVVSVDFKSTVSGVDPCLALESSLKEWSERAGYNHERRRLDAECLFEGSLAGAVEATADGSSTGMPTRIRITMTRDG